MLITAGLAKAQEDKYTTAMKKGIMMMNSAKNTDDLLASANQFDRIAAVEGKQWLPLYYSAYSNLVAGIRSADNSQKDILFDKALEQAEKAGNLSADNSEIYTLKGYATFMKMTVDPQGRAMSLIPEVQAALEKAKALNPANPRPYFVAGQNAFYTPEAFGGGKQNAKPILETATEKYASFKPANELAPAWGAERCKMLLQQCN